MSRRLVLGTGIVLGVLLTAGVLLWWGQGPSTAEVRRTVITTMQEEAPASFLVTGTLNTRVTVRIDSAQYMTPDWLTYVLAQGQPGVLSLLKGSSQTEVQVPGRVSYGFNVQALTPEMITLEGKGVVSVNLPELSVHSVEPDLARLRVRSSTEGWMRIFSTEVPQAVRTRALSGVKTAFRRQAQNHLASATQPRVNTAKALRKMLTPPLKAAGLSNPRFRIRIGDQLWLRPDSTEPQTFRKD